MKPVSQMSRLELAAWIGAALARAGVDVVLSGGSCVSIYSGDRYVSMDEWHLDKHTLGCFSI